MRAATQWANLNKSLLNSIDTAANYKQRAINYLTSHSIFNSDEFIDTVLYDEDEERRSRAKASLKSFFKNWVSMGKTTK